MTEHAAPTDDALARLQALQASRGQNPPVATPTATATSKAPSTRTGPPPARIVAAAASVAAGIGLVAVMAGAQQDVVVQVNPTPVTVQPASVIVEVQSTGDQTEVREVRVVEAPAPVEQPAPRARVVTQSEGS